MTEVTEVTEVSGLPRIYRFPFPPFPAGWFRVADSGDVRIGQLRHVRYFGRELVLWRSSHGAVQAMDAYCPHLGAHLGQGSIVGDTVQCPFHGWRFDTTGSCVYVTHDRKIPPKAKLGTWPVTETNGQVLVWFHPRHEAPTWQVPRFAEADDPEWTGFRKGTRWPNIRTHVQEFMENGFDVSHLDVLHQEMVADPKTVELQILGPQMRHRIMQTSRAGGPARLFSSDITGPVDLLVSGLGIGLARASAEKPIKLAYSLLFYITPVDEEHIEAVSMVAVKRLRGKVATHIFLRKVRAGMVAAVEADIPIWENKLFRPRPILTEGEQPIMQFRRWATQFYDPS